MKTIKQLCPSCNKKHTFEIGESFGKISLTSCPNTGELLKGKIEIIAKKQSKMERLVKNKKFWFWYGIFWTGHCSIVGCIDFIAGYWGFGILMIVCILISFKTAKDNADY